MRFTTASIIALAGVASAGFLDNKACNDVSACVSASGCQYDFTSIQPSDPAYKCGTGGDITYQQSARNLIDFQNGLSAHTQVTKADFPENCDLGQPGPNSTLLKAVTNDMTVYGFIEYDCSKRAPVGRECFDNRPDINTGSATICQVQRNGQVCKAVVDTVWTRASCRAS